jgi:site-specific recombinase XerD
MTTQPTRRRLEPGIYERVDAAGERLGLEIAYKDASGKVRRRTVHGGVQDARDELAKARTRRVGREAEPNDPRVTFDTVCDAFDAAHVAGLRPNSQRVYRTGLRRLRARFRGRRLSSISRVDLRAFVAAERAEGLKANTITSHLAVLSAVYAFARDDLDMPVAMPRLKASERPRRDDARERRILTDDELARVLAAAGERERLYFRTLAETGARMGEGLGITRRRIDVEAATLSFAEQFDRYGELAPLKTRTSRRTIEITRSLAAALALAGPERAFAHLTHASADKAWRRTLKRAKIADPQPTLHDLRHTHVSGPHRRRVGPRRDRGQDRRHAADDARGLRPRVRRTQPRRSATQGARGPLRHRDGNPHTATDRNRRGARRRGNRRLAGRSQQSAVAAGYCGHARSVLQPRHLHDAAARRHDR